jgi:hypothetical protein
MAVASSGRFTGGAGSTTGLPASTHSVSGAQAGDETDPLPTDPDE